MPDLKVAEGVALHYVRSGVVDAEETVVFVNGLTMDTTAWGAVAEGLAARYATLRFDSRGQGESDKPAGPYTPEQHAADLKALLTGLELDRVHLVGLSNGGLVATLLAGALAQTEPERILSLTLIDSFAQVDPLLRVILRSWRAALEAGGSALRFDVATPWVWGHSFLAEHLAEVMALRDKAAQAAPDAVRYLIDGLMGFGHARDALRAYPGPLLTIVGDEDVLTPARYSQEILDWAGHGELVTVARAGHASPIERPEDVIRVLQSFLETRALKGVS